MLITKKTQKKQTKLPVASGPLKTGGGREKKPQRNWNRPEPSS